MMTAATCQPYLGQWVRCHSIYGVHRGVVSAVRPGGIMLGNATRLASATRDNQEAFRSIFRAVDDAEWMQVFGFGFGAGLFIPFGGLYGFYPGFFW